MRIAASVAALAALAASWVALADAPSKGSKEAKDAVSGGSATAPAAAPAPSARASSPLVQSAAAYALYREDVFGIEAAGFRSAKDLDSAFEKIASHTPDKLARAWTAYAALIAAQSPSFVDGVRQAAEHYSRDAVIQGLVNDATYAARLNVANPAATEDAKRMVLASIDKDAARIRAAGENVRMAGYTLQDFSWAKSKPASDAKRIALMTNAEGKPRLASPVILEEIAAPGVLDKTVAPDLRNQLAAAFRRAFGNEPEFGLAVSAPAGPSLSLELRPAEAKSLALDQALTLAALDALNAAGDSNLGAVSQLLRAAEPEQCLVDVRLWMHGCVAAVNFRYEDPFCIARHGMTDVSGCMSKIAGR